jgi:hypothetical protein
VLCIIRVGAGLRAGHAVDVSLQAGVLSIGDSKLLLTRLADDVIALGITREAIAQVASPHPVSFRAAHPDLMAAVDREMTARTTAVLQSVDGKEGHALLSDVEGDRMHAIVLTGLATPDEARDYAITRAGADAKVTVEGNVVREEMMVAKDGSGAPPP